MATIQDIRKQYPQYEDMSDEQLARALHGKFYSDMPYDQFAGRIGLSARTQNPLTADGVVNADADVGMPLTDMAKGAIKNFPQSAANAGKSIIAPFVEIAKAPFTGEMPILDSLGATLHGAAQKTGFLSPGLPDKTAYVDALKQAISERYGGIENIKQTIATDPVGALLDVASVVQPTAAIAGKVGAGSKVAAAAEKVASSGRFLDPLFYVGKGVSAIRTPESIYASALKPSTTMRPTERDAMISAAIRERIPLSRGGIDRANSIIDDGARAVDALVNEASSRGGSVSANTAASSIDEVTGRNVANPKDLAPAQAVKKQFLDAYNQASNFDLDSQIPLGVANEIKRNIWKELSSKMGKIGSEFSYADEAKRALGSGLRRAIEEAVPEVAASNQRISPLMDLVPELQRAVNRSENWNLFGLGAPMIGGMAGIGAGSAPAGFLAAALFRGLENPLNKSVLAILLDRARKGQLPTSTAAGGVSYPYLASEISGYADQ